MAEPTEADVERAGHWLSEVGMTPTVYYADHAAQLIANLREECAAKCDALENEFATAYANLPWDDERQLTLRAQADGCASCARTIREVNHD
jgi:hypothetical protein